MTTTTVTIPATGTYAIDASHSHVGFRVRHLMVAKVRGRFADVEGTVTIAEDPLQSAVEASISLASVDTRDEQRDAHLRSPDFFDVEQHPTMSFRSLGITEAGDGWDVEGDLTLHGVTRRLTLHVTFDGTARDPWGGERAGFSAHTQLNREDFGLTWNQTLESGGVLVGKTVDVEIEVELVKS